MHKKSKIYIAGHKGLVGSAIINDLVKKGYDNLIYKDHVQLDLIRQDKVKEFFEKEKPEYVILAAARVGGIIANNTYRADFIYQNMMIQNNVIHHSFLNNVKKLLFLGSTCVYPKKNKQPIKEETLLTSPLEYTNEPYAIAKISGLKMCESYNLQYGTNFLTVMPSNLYGPNDNFNLEKSHVLPALIRKIHIAKCIEHSDWLSLQKDLLRRPIKGVDSSSSKDEILHSLSKYGVTIDSVEIWGSGKPKREFLWSEDMADACIFLLENIDFRDTFENNLHEIKNTHINIGTGYDISIKDLTFLISDIIGYSGCFNFNTLKPDGTMRKLSDSKKINKLGWKHKVSLEEGIKRLYDWYIS
tara:strand:- start:164 stop:1234 length:1071 start_codon:yes stop_codon:yes gene_type:complete